MLHIGQVVLDIELDNYFYVKDTKDSFIFLNGIDCNYNTLRSSIENLIVIMDAIIKE